MPTNHTCVTQHKQPPPRIIREGMVVMVVGTRGRSYWRLSSDGRGRRGVRVGRGRRGGRAYHGWGWWGHEGRNRQPAATDAGRTGRASRKRQTKPDLTAHTPSPSHKTKS